MPGRPPRFLIERGAADAGRVQLASAEAHHAHVRRLRRDATVELFDGEGGSWIGRVYRVGRDGLSVEIERALPAVARESALEITLALAVLKADRFDWVIEKATELGVNVLLPFISQNSLARPSDRRQARWRQIAAGAAKQCGRSAVPRIETPIGWQDLLARPAACRLLFWEDERQCGLASIASTATAPAAVTLVIGPEGGFAAAEVEEARAAGCRLIGIGPRILRAETAAVCAIALCQYLWGDLGSADTMSPE